MQKCYIIGGFQLAAKSHVNLNELSEDVHGQIEFPAEVILYLIR